MDIKGQRAKWEICLTWKISSLINFEFSCKEFKLLQHSDLISANTVGYCNKNQQFLVNTILTMKSLRLNSISGLFIFKCLSFFKFLYLHMINNYYMFTPVYKGAAAALRNTSDHIF